MGKTGAPKRPTATSAKRRLPDAVPADANPSTNKKLLSSNPYAVLCNGEELPSAVEKKEKVPPFFVKGFPDGLKEKIDFFIKKEVKCTIRLCTEGYKLMVPDINHYKAMQTILEQEKCEYFSHDIEANKPFKVVLRGLPDMGTDQLSEE